MGVEENKAVIRRFCEEVWNKGNLDVMKEIFAADYVRHDLRPGTPPPGPEGQKKIAADFRGAFPDLHTTVDLMVAEGDMVVVRWTTEGTNTGPWGGIPPTGKQARFSGVNIFRMKNGKVVEIWNHRDDLGLMQQLGAPIYAGSKD
jgi:steroid delta-isomerase-like uncharacterized protein